MNWSFGSFVQISLLGINLLITSKMSLPDRGRYALIVAVLVTVSGLCNFGFANALIKRLHEDSISRAYFGAMVATATVQIAFAILVSMLLLHSLPNVTNETIYQNGPIMITVMVSLVLRVHMQSILLGLNRINHFQASKIVPVFLFFAVLYSRGRYDLTSVLLAWLASEAVLVALMTVYLAFNLKLIGRDDSRVFGHDLRFGFRSMFGQTSFIEGYKFDQILVGYLLPLTEVAIYAVAKSVSLLLRFVPQSLSQVAYPAVLRGADKERLGIIKVYVLFSIIASVGLIASGQYLFDTYVVSFIGQQYSRSSAILLLLFLGVFFYAPRRILYEYYKSINKPGITSIFEFLVLATYTVGLGALLLFGAVNLTNLATLILVVNLAFLLIVLRDVYLINERLYPSAGIPASEVDRN